MLKKTTRNELVWEVALSLPIHQSRRYGTKIRPCPLHPAGLQKTHTPMPVRIAPERALRRGLICGLIFCHPESRGGRSLVRVATWAPAILVDHFAAHGGQMSPVPPSQIDPVSRSRTRARVSFWQSNGLGRADLQALSGMSREFHAKHPPWLLQVPGTLNSPI